jgi:YidC/Oxa1 family membrane protein insertase
MLEIISNPWDNLFYDPVYNLVVFLSNNIVDAGVVIVLTTIIIKLILFPLFNKQINSQIATKKAKPEIDALTKKYKGKKLTKEESHQKVVETMALYKKYDIKPFSSLLILFIQIPALFALYWIFFKGGLPEVDSDLLYSFVGVPQDISMNFMGIFELEKTSYVLAFLAGVTQYMHLHTSMPDVKFSDLKKKGGSDVKTDMLNSFQVNIKYGLPFLIFFMLISVFNSALAVYWITLNIFSTAQEFVVRDKKSLLKK